MFLRKNFITLAVAVFTAVLVGGILPVAASTGDYDPFYTKTQSNARYYTKTQSNARYYTKTTSDHRYWKLGGNAGTTPGTNFLGTTDNKALEFKVNSAQALRLEPNATSPNLVGGFSGNSVTAGAFGATIGGGGGSTLTNGVTDNFGTIGGGENNQAGDGDATTTNAIFATVGGGGNNTASTYYATVGGGNSNTASGNAGTVAGGNGNTAGGSSAAVGGGNSNSATGSYTTVGGGDSNTASSTWATVGGGYSNTASTNSWTTVGGGKQNQATGESSTVGGGKGNTATDSWATVGGGENNTAGGSHATVGGGLSNQANYYATVGGGSGNVANIGYATIGGGLDNYVNWSTGTVGGGANNTVHGLYATIPGGLQGVATHYGEVAHASGRFADDGDAQTSESVLRNVTTNATQTDLFLDGSGGSWGLTLSDGQTFTFDALVVARTANAGAKSAGYEVTGVIQNVGGTVSFVGTPTVTTFGETDSAWDVAASADNTNKILDLKVTGAASTTIRWVAMVKMAEVSFVS